MGGGHRQGRKKARTERVMGGGKEGLRPRPGRVKSLPTDTEHLHLEALASKACTAFNHLTCAHAVAAAATGAWSDKKLSQCGGSHFLVFFLVFEGGCGVLVLCLAALLAFCFCALLAFCFACQRFLLFAFFALLVFFFFALLVCCFFALLCASRFLLFVAFSFLVPALAF